jgi:hypothetical protein
MNTFNQTTSSHPLSNTNIFNQRINTEEMFEYAIEQANVGKQNQALDIAREALIKAKQNNLYIELHPLSVRVKAFYKTINESSDNQNAKFNY